jgi:autotransporter-associated beta strand protein
MKSKHRILITLTTAVFYQLAATAQAQTTYNWTSETDGTWGTDINWTPNGIPGTDLTDIAVFNSPSTVSTITLDGSFILDSVSFGVENPSWTIDPGTDSASALTLGVNAVKFTVTNTIVNFNAALNAGVAANELRVSGDGGTVNFTGNLGSRTSLGSLTTPGTVGMTYNLDAVDIVKSRFFPGFNNGVFGINGTVGTTVNVNASQKSASEMRVGGGTNATIAGVLNIRNGATWESTSEVFALGFSSSGGTNPVHGRVEVGAVGDPVVDPTIVGNLTIGNTPNFVIADRAGFGILNINNGIVTVNSNNDTKEILLASSIGAIPVGGNGTINLNAGGTLVTARNFTIAATGAPTGTFNFDGGLLRINRATGNVTTDLFRTGITVNVLDGGARIDTQANSTVINLPLEGVGTGGLEKLGDGTLTLSGASTYTGPTTVTTGTLAVTGSLGDTAVTVNSPAILGGNGNIGGNVTIDSGATHALAVAATPGAQATRAITGTLTLTAGNLLNLTAAATPASGEYVLATATTISGTTAEVDIDYNGIPGTVTIDTASDPDRLLLTVTSASFSSWINGTFANPLAEADRGPNDDPDNDGISNLVEYAIAGQDPTVANTTIGTFTGNTLSFAKRQPLASDLTYSIETSIDLGATPWTVAPAGPSYVNDGTTISYLLPGSNPKDFMRLKVVKNP